MRLGDVYSISPQALMFTNVVGINELHIDAGMPSRCLDLLHNLKKTRTEIFKEFKDRLMLVRSLTITEIHTIPMKREHFAALIGKMKVEELNLVTALPPANRATLADLKFAEIETQGEDQPNVHWNTTDPKMNLKKLTYEGVDTLPCADVIAKLCTWFSVQKLLDITLPKKRNFEDLKDDLTATLPLLKAFTGAEIRTKWFCERAEDKIPKYDRLCNDITHLYKEDFPSLLPVKYSSEEEFLLTLRDKDGAKKTLQFTFSIADPPAPEQVQVPVERDERRAANLERFMMALERREMQDEELRRRDHARFLRQAVMRMQMEEEEAPEAPHRGD